MCSHRGFLSLAHGLPVWPPRPPWESCECSYVRQAQAVGCVHTHHLADSKSPATNQRGRGRLWRARCPPLLWEIIALSLPVCMRISELEGLPSRSDLTLPLTGATSHVRFCFCNYRFALASHFFWGLWSIVQAKISSIEFGYMVCFGGGFSLLPGKRNASVCECLAVNVLTEGQPFPEPGELAPRRGTALEAAEERLR